MIYNVRGKSGRARKPGNMIVRAKAGKSQAEAASGNI